MKPLYGQACRGCICLGCVLASQGECPCCRNCFNAREALITIKCSGCEQWPAC